MTVKDVLGMSFGNLWRMKTRSFLTISGVIIGIMALSSLLSFGVGMQQLASENFELLELFTSLQVLPHSVVRSEREDHTAADTTAPRVVMLNDSVMQDISRIPGVASVYPEDVFSARVECRGREANTSVYALLAQMGQSAPYSRMKKGRFFSSDSARETVIARELAVRLGFKQPDSILGQEIEVVTASMNPGAALPMFMSGGKVSPFREMRYKLTVCGLLKSDGLDEQPRQLIVPWITAQNMEKISFRSAFDILSMIRKGGKGYSSLTVRMKSYREFEAVRDTLEARGYRTFSIADQFEEMKKAFMIIDTMLGAVGMLALVVASLGIANTMIMSITERFREIGVMKSLGADDRHIQLLFLAESGVVGFIGGVVGLTFGWILTRIAAVVIMWWMEKQGQTGIDVFAMPWWLMLASVAFGVGVSLLAGALPSRRAAKVDPVHSLRHD
jgi:putative ABC transport system permease protein